MRLQQIGIKLLTVLLIAIIFAGTDAYSQSQYPSSLLEQKGNFSAGAARALGQPFHGLTTSDGIIKGLFPIKSTGSVNRSN